MFNPLFLKLLISSLLQLSYNADSCWPRVLIVPTNIDADRCSIFQVIVYTVKMLHAVNS